MFYDSLKRDFYIIAYSYFFYDPFGQKFYTIAYDYMV